MQVCNCRDPLWSDTVSEHDKVFALSKYQHSTQNTMVENDGNFKIENETLKVYANAKIKSNLCKPQINRSYRTTMYLLSGPSRSFSVSNFSASSELFLTSNCRKLLVG